MPSKPPLTRPAILARLPGLAICLAITAIAVGIQAIEERAFDHPYVEALVMAILIGVAVRTAWTPGDRFRSGIAFGAKQMLEIAVTLLGASLSLGAIVASGPALLIGILATVVLTLGASFGLCRMLGLPKKMSILIACGNSICGNSAIAAVAPVIDADSNDVAASIAFTAAIGVLMVIGLPLFVPLAGLSEHQYGVLAGLTVYAVPQVLAATVPVGLISTQVGTLVKLVRVLMLGPVVVTLSLLAPLLRLDPAADARTSKRLKLATLVPWFIIGFLLLATLRSLGLIPVVALKPLAQTATFLTVVSMAALGLGVDARELARAGSRVTMAVTLSLAVLIAISFILIRALGIS